MALLLNESVSIHLNNSFITLFFPNKCCSLVNSVNPLKMSMIYVYQVAQSVCPNHESKMHQSLNSQGFYAYSIFLRLKPECLLVNEYTFSECNYVIFGRPSLWGSSPRKKNLLSWEKILPFRADPIWKELLSSKNMK